MSGLRFTYEFGSLNSWCVKTWISRTNKSVSKKKEGPTKGALKLAKMHPATKKCCGWEKHAICNSLSMSHRCISPSPSTKKHNLMCKMIVPVSQLLLIWRSCYQTNSTQCLNINSEILWVIIPLYGKPCARKNLINTFANRTFSFHSILCKSYLIQIALISDEFFPI